jgi:hypothetical protein
MCALVRACHADVRLELAIRSRDHACGNRWAWGLFLLMTARAFESMTAVSAAGYVPSANASEAHRYGSKGRRDLAGTAKRSAES